MKKRFLKIVAILCLFLACFSVVSCKKDSKELLLETEYHYDRITFNKAEGMTLNDVSAFVPIFPAITTVKEFEDCIRDNIDTYSIERLTENGRERLYLKPEISWVKIKGNNPYIADGYFVILKYYSEEYERSWGAKKEENRFVFENPSAPEDFYFSNGELCYELRFNEKFAVVYHYKVKTLII